MVAKIIKVVVPLSVVSAVSIFAGGWALGQSDDPGPVTVDSTIEEKITALDTKAAYYEEQMAEVVDDGSYAATFELAALQSRLDRVNEGVASLCAQLPTDGPPVAACEAT